MRILASTWLAIGLVVVTASGCGRPDAPPAPPPTQVTVERPAATEVVDRMQFDGTVAPTASVDLVARVAGFLQAAPFREGDLVRKGDVLFVIEPEPYRQQVALNQAQVDQARAEADRQRVLLSERATATSSVEKAESSRRQAEANLRLAQINLDYTIVRAPFDGVIGRRQVDVGNVVGAGGGTVLGTVVKVSPAYVKFSVNERDLLRLREHAPRDDRTGRAALGKLTVEASLQGETTPSETGVLDFIDTGLAASSGALAMRARFDNSDRHLVPGLYARVTVAVGAPRRAWLVPDTAVQSDQQGRFVFVVDAQDRVVRRNVVVGALFDHRREIVSGLGGDDRVIVSGIGKVTPGATVATRRAEGSS